jgi:ATP-dependent Clp endopeptidase proteolytic subunit ClpP
MSKPNYRITCKAGKAELYIYDVIDNWGMGAQQVAKDLKALGPIKSIDVRLNSPGGNVFDGLAIYNILKQHPAKVTTHVDGMALSIASLVAMAGDEIRIADNAFMMIHDPMGSTYSGDAEDHRETAELLDKLKGSLVDTYAARTDIDAKTITEMMAEETWLDAAEAVEWGFADVVTESLSVAAHADPDRFKNTPDSFRKRIEEKSPMAEDKTPKPATFDELKAACPEAPADFLCSQLEGKAVIDDAKAAWSTYQIEEAKKEAANAKAEADAAKAEAKVAAEKAAAAATAPGVDPLADDDKGGKPTGETGGFWDLVNELVAAGMKKPKAIRQTVKDHPEAHEAMLVEANEGRKKR